MAKPRKSTYDAWVDQFCDWSIEDQERALDMCEFVHRQTKRRKGRKDEEAQEQQTLPETEGRPVR